MNIITGYRNDPHITSQQLRNTYIPIFGKDACILDVGSKMAVTVISANEVEVADGQLICEGCTAEIAHGTTESLTIDNGTQGEQRIDLIVARYTKNVGTGVEDMQLAVVKGAPAASNPAVPSYNTGTIADGDSPVDFPIYRVNIDGISITSVDALVGTANIFDSIEDLYDKVEVLYEDDLTMRLALDRDNVTINAGQSYVWFNAHVPVAGYRAKGIAGTRLFDAVGGGNYLNCGFSFCETYWNAELQCDDLDFAIRNHGTATAKIRYHIEVLYQKVR
jgi:hypothetical protein